MVMLLHSHSRHRAVALALQLIRGNNVLESFLRLLVRSFYIVVNLVDLNLNDINILK